MPPEHLPTVSTENEHFYQAILQTYNSLVSTPGNNQIAAAFRDITHREPHKRRLPYKGFSKTCNGIYVHSEKSAAHIQKSYIKLQKYFLKSRIL